MTHQPSFSQPLPFIDLRAQRRRLGARVDEAIRRVLDHGQFIMGPEVKMLEAELAEFCGAREVVSCASGTDALLLLLMAKGVKPGDAVLCPSFTFAATAEVVVLLGATPVFVDVRPDTFNIDVASLEPGLAAAKRHGLNPVGVITVDLFGQPADYEAIEAFCNENGLWLLSDAAQSFGATYKGRKVGTLGFATAASFFPAKPLGCYGDGGAIFTEDSELAAVLRSMRIHGYGADKYDHVRIGINGRMDTIQAAALIEKLKIFPDEIARRDAVAGRYTDALRDCVATPHIAPECTSVWAQYTIKLPAGQRAGFAETLAREGIPTAIHYPKPLHQQTAYRGYPAAGNGLPVSEQVAQEVISLPMHPYLEPEVQDRIVAATRRAFAG